MYNRNYKSNNYNNKNLVNRDYEYDSEYKKDLNVVNEDNQENDYETVQGTDYDEQYFLDYEYEDGTKESVRVKAEGWYEFFKYTLKGCRYYKSESPERHYPFGKVLKITFAFLNKKEYKGFAVHV